MRILLCDKKTGLHYQHNGVWTAQRDRAENLGTSPEAILYARQHGLQQVDLFWDFDDDEYNVRLPLAA
jgi:hypothetical protein